MLNKPLHFATKAKVAASKRSLPDQQSLEIACLHAFSNMKKGYRHQLKKQYRYNIIWVKQGQGKFFFDTAVHEIQNNSIYCMAPGPLQLMNAELTIDGYVISFTQDFLDLLYNNFFSAFPNALTTQNLLSAINLCDESQFEIGHIVTSMLKELQDFKLLRKEILRNYLQILLIYVSRQANFVHIANPEHKKTRFVAKFFDLLDQNYCKKRTVFEYADMLAVSSSHLNEIIKGHTGHPVSYHIQQKIIKEAKRNALFTDLSLKEIAYELGFEDRSHFSKFFKAFEGRNFSEFRKAAVEQFR
jgi:AraC family transcriptional activator of pobA